MSPVPPAHKHRARIEAELTRLLYQNMPASYTGTAITAALLAVIMWRAVPRGALLAWLVFTFVLATARHLLWRTYRRRRPAAPDYRPWLNYAIAAGALSGTIWGAASVVFFVPGEVTLQAVLLIVLMGISLMSLAAHGCHLPAFAAFFFPCTTPAALVLLTQATGLHTLLAVLTVVLMAAMSGFALNLSRAMQLSLRLQFENLDLAREMKAQKEAAERATQAKSRFLAAASHDLRQPMHAMSLYVEALGVRPLAEDDRRLLRNVRDCIDAMGRLFRALLDVSRLDAGVVHTEISTFALGPLLEGVRIEFEPPARQRGLRLRVMPTSLRAHSDPALLERVVRNLVSNAIRYTDRGRVLVGCRRRGTEVRLIVCDTGRGIPRDKQPMIFEEFYQIGNPERDRTQGLGLGLAIVDRLVKLMGLKLTLRSAVGKGTLFAVDMPAADRQATAAHPTDAAMAADQAGLSGRLVVVIDDEAGVLDATRRVLEDWGCNVLTAGSGLEAVRALADSPRIPDLAICDHRLRADENGIAVIARLREEFNCEIPALLVTGDTGPDRLRQAEQSGLVLLHKPLDPVTLRAEMKRLLSTSAQVASRSGDAAVTSP